MKRLLIIVLMLAALSTSAYSQSLDEITWMTEEYPPLNYTENGVNKGLFVEILMSMLVKLGVETTKHPIQVLPWARSYLMLKERQGTALFAMSRTEERETLFKWVGPVSIPPIGIIAKKEKRYQIESMADISDIFSDKQLGVVKNDSGEQYFLERQGDPKLLHRVSTGKQLVRMLEADRFKAIAYLYSVAVFNMKASNIDHQNYELVYPLTNGAQGWFGFHKDIDQKIIDRLQKAFDDLTSEGVIEKISVRYFE